MPKTHASKRAPCAVVADSLRVSKSALPERNIRHLASFPRLNPSPILECDLSGTITYCNPAALDLLQQMGLENAGVFLPEDFSQVLKILGTKAAGPVYRERTIQDRVFEENLYFASEFKTVRIYILEVTKHKKIEQVLRTSEAQLHFILNNTPMFVFAWNTGGIFTFCEGLALQRIGFEPRDLIGKPVTEIAAAQSFMRQNGAVTPFSKIVQRTLDGESLFGLVELNGIHFDMKVVPILDRDDRVTAVVGIAIDVSEHIHAQEQVKQQIVELERWQNVILAREDRVQELKREVNALLARLGEPARYASQVE